MPVNPPIVVWSLEGALLRRDNAQVQLVAAVHGWMGRGGQEFDVPATGAAGFREQTDNEVVRATLFRAGIDPQDWMVQGALAHHERGLASHLRHAPCLATPGIERALHNVATEGAEQLVLSWHTAHATQLKLASARISKPFELSRAQHTSHHSIGVPNLKGIFSADKGSFEGVLEALARWAGGVPIAFITASPREIIAASRVGISCIGVTSGGIHPTELSMSGASLVVTERTGLEQIHRMLTGAPLVNNLTGRAPDSNDASLSVTCSVDLSLLGRSEESAEKKLNLNA